MVLDGKPTQEYPVNAGVPQGSTVGPTLFLLYNDVLLDDAICNIAIYADDSNMQSQLQVWSAIWSVVTFSWNWIIKFLWI